MGLRETVNTHKSVATIVAVLVPVVLIGWFCQSRAEMRRATERVSLAWYSDDDGKSWFAQDQRLEMPPFDHNGKRAYRAYLFTCDGGKTKFVGYLERYTPEALRMMKNASDAAKHEPPVGGAADALRSMGIECKKPGSGSWMNLGDMRAKQIRIVTCPNGGSVQPVLPQ